MAWLEWNRIRGARAQSRQRPVATMLGALLQRLPAGERAALDSPDRRRRCRRGRDDPEVGDVRRGAPRGGRAEARAAAAAGRGRGRREEPVRGHEPGRHQRADRLRRGPRARADGVGPRPPSGRRSRRTARAASSARRASSSTSPACLHPKFGAPTRDAVGGVSILPSVKKRAAMGATLDIPVHHIKAMLVRSHFDAMEIRVPDAPAADELAARARGERRRPAARPRRRPQGRGRGRRGRPPLGRRAERPGARSMRTLITQHRDARHRRHRRRRSPTPTRS